MLARKAMEQAQRLREERQEEKQRLKQDKALSWKQKVGRAGRQQCGSGRQLRGQLGVVAQALSGSGAIYFMLC